MRNRLARQMVKSRVAWVIILTMFLNTFSIQAAYAAGEIAVPEEPAALEEAEAAAVEKEEGETEGKPRLDDNNYTGDAAWLKDWDGGTPTLSGDYVILSKYTGDISENLIIPATVSINNKGYKIKLSENSSRMFLDHHELKSISFNEGVDTENVTTMTRMFYGCSSLTSLDVTKFDTSNVTSMGEMFHGCSSLTSLDVTKFDTKNVTYMGGMFSGCSGLTSLDVTKFNTSNVTFMTGMFYGCSSLTSLDVTKFDTSNVVSMMQMFYGCSGLTSLDVTKFNTSNVTAMRYMFYGCSSLTSLDFTRFNTSNVTNMERMFSGCSGLTSLDVTKFDTSNVTVMGGMFYGCSSLTSLDVTGFNTAQVQYMHQMFYNCQNLNSLDVTGFNTAQVKSMEEMFYNCQKLTSLSLDRIKFNTENVENMRNMFYNCQNLTSLDVAGFKTGNVQRMAYMFSGCKKLTSLSVNNFDTRSVGTGDLPWEYDAMEGMFYGCSSLTSLDVSGFDTSNVTAMGLMFSGCKSLTSLSLNGAKFSTDNVNRMTHMFRGCSSLTNLDISNFDLSNVLYTVAIFEGDISLNEIKTPKNLSVSINLPGTFMKKDVVPIEKYTELPKGQSESMTLVRYFDADKITLNPSRNSIKVGEKFTVSASITPDNTTEKTINWTTSDNTIASVKGNGSSCEVSGNGVGTTIITAETANHKTATCVVTVSANIADTTWQKDWDYTLSGDSIILSKYTGANTNKTVKHLDVPASATISGNTYHKVKFGPSADSMFMNHEELISIDLGNVDTSEVVSMESMFQLCSNLASLDLSSFNTRNVRNMNHMFWNCQKLKNLNLSRFNTGNVVSMNSMFNTCKELTSLNLSSFDTGKVTDMGNMFSGCEKIESINFGNKFATNRVTNMVGMFNSCKKLTSLDLSFDTANVTNMDLMFVDCFGLESLNLSSFDFSNVWEGTTYGFLYGCNKLNRLKTPKNVSVSINLPATFIEEGGSAAVKYTTIPQKTNRVMTLVRYDDVESISLNETEKTISVNETFQLKATTVPPDALVTWTSSKDSVATVDKYGNVTGITEGDATITARTSNGKTKTCKIMVRGYKTIPVTGITVSPEILAIAVGDSSYITPTVYPLNATDKKVTWKSNSVSVAAVDKNGRVTGKAPGTAKITATAGRFSAECLVTVKKSAVRRPYSGLDPRLFYQAEKTADTYKAELVKGQKYSLGKGVWTTTDPKTVSVKKKTGVLTAKKAGTAKLTDTGGKTTEFNMTVYEPKLAVTSVTVLVGDIVNVSIRNTGSLPVSWVSGDIHKASVIMNEEDDNRAVITGVGKGKTRVYAYVNGKAFPVTVNVRDQAALRTLAANDSIRINAFNPVALKYISRDFKPSKVIKWSDTAGLEWRKDSKGNRTDHTGAVTISKGGKVTGNTAADSSPVIALGRDSNGNSVVLEITVDAIPVKTDVYMNVGQTASLKHSYVKNSDRVRWIYDNKNINLSNADKVKTRIKALAAGEGTATCRYQDMEYYTYVHVEDPEVITEGGMKRTKPSAYNYTLSLKKGGSYDIGMSGVYQDVLWRSNKQEVAFVDEYGRISARGRGKATLSTTVNKRKLKINVTVTD